jgi:hypothetical protein
MEDAVAEPAQHGGEGERPVRGGDARHSHGPGEQRHPAGQHAARAEVIDEKTRAGLSDARGRVEETHEEPELGVRHREGVAEQREEGRQGELEEVADEVGRAYQRHDADIALEAAVPRLGCRANHTPPGDRSTPGRRPGAASA